MNSFSFCRKGLSNLCPIKYKYLKSVYHFFFRYVHEKDKIFKYFQYMGSPKSDFIGLGEKYFVIYTLTYVYNFKKCFHKYISAAYKINHFTIKYSRISII